MNAGVFTEPPGFTESLRSRALLQPAGSDSSRTLTRRATPAWAGPGRRSFRPGPEWRGSAWPGRALQPDGWTRRARPCSSRTDSISL
eukprot:753741-Hanusia_phi.AAC.1